MGTRTTARAGHRIFRSSKPMKPAKQNMKTATTRKPKPAASTEPAFRVVRAPESEPALAGVKKLNLGALTKAPSGKSSKVHPQIVISGETRALLQQFLEVEPQFKTLEKQSKSLKEQ